MRKTKVWSMKIGEVVMLRIEQKGAGRFDDVCLKGQEIQKLHDFIHKIIKIPEQTVLFQ